MILQEQQGQEQRKYIRLDSVFPVQFRLISLDSGNFLSGWLQGFTNNIGPGGLCLQINNLGPEICRLIKNKAAQFSLEIELPVIKSPVKAEAKAAWIKEDAGSACRYIIGLHYTKIDSRQNNLIIGYSRAKRSFIPIILATALIFGLSFFVSSFINIKLTKNNRVLLEQLNKVQRESSSARGKIEKFNREKEHLEGKLKALQTRIQVTEQQKVAIGSQKSLESAQGANRTEELNILTARLNKEKDVLIKELAAVRHKEGNVNEQILSLDKRKIILEKATFDKLYHWLKVHQNPRTGLVMSFEGDQDIADWAFTYDQSLVAQSYINFSDFTQARKIFDFFYHGALRREDMFLNAYYANNGEPAEHIVHSGPNIWLGIAILHYTKQAKDNTYLPLAEEIAQKIMQLEDESGGVAGGPGLGWYSTEHNLDAYAFFNMLYKISANIYYKEAADKVLAWLVKHTYDRADLPVKRGRGDSTIATDTYAWSIAAIGPQKLEELGMDPEKILEFAEQNCQVEVSYAKPDGSNPKIKGFDFSAKQNLARGGVISSEWTAQMVIAYKIMADFYAKKAMIEKANLYRQKAAEYLAGLTQMIISSPSPSGQGDSCLAYASADGVDTGHGWFTPKGKSTGSVAGTAYTLFAYYNYNPLELK